MSPTEATIQVPSDDPKKKSEKPGDKDKNGVASKVKDDPNEGEGEELVLPYLSNPFERY
jgi:hypothetical protein